MNAPDCSYVALPSYVREDSDTATWVSDYPGIGHLTHFPMTVHTVQQASTSSPSLHPTVTPC